LPVASTSAGHSGSRHAIQILSEFVPYGPNSKYKAPTQFRI
jgi:hypothetical protein